MNPFDLILGRSSAAAELRDFARRAAAVDAPLLLTGESGTGKGLVARAVHAASDRARRSFVAINCAGVPETLFESEFFGHDRGAFTGAQQTRRGLFEQAHGGTLFLDEVGEMAASLQAKLLTAIEDGEIRRLGAERTLSVDVRIIAATNEDLDDAVRERRFRRDLYHRLLVLAYRVPALREREGDIEYLAGIFLARHADRYRRPIAGFAPSVLRRLNAYPWPGNVRELDHAVEAAVLACDDGPIRLRHLPPAVLEGATARDARLALPHGNGNGNGGNGGNGTGGDGPEGAPIVQPVRYSFHGSPAAERRRILETLHRCRGNKTRAAEALGMARNTLRAKLRAHGIEPASSG